MRKYDHKKIEAKWQKRWEEMRLYRTDDDPKKPKCYVLDEFPYPSGEGLHAGHTRIYTASDVYARMKRMQGYNVLHPTGWDAFGLPAEQFAIKHKTHPLVSVKKNTERYKKQMKSLGLSYDWEREINTTDPAYYKWTQWAFLKMFERGLAYESFEPINWCKMCQTGLANEDLDGGNCERCDTPVEKKPMRQWMIRITKYADRLIDDLDTLPEWPEAIKEAQRNWIGRSEGAVIQFSVSSFQFLGNAQLRNIEVFTTRPDTLFGVTFVAISAELAKKWIDSGWKAESKVKKFIEKTIVEEAKRGHDEVPEKEGIASGIMAINPVNKEKIPVWIANYVLSGYGTGAIMAVPAHDARDYDFAKKFKLPVRPVIYPAHANHSHKDMVALKKLPAEDLTRQADRYINESGAYVGEGFLINSGQFDGENSFDAKKKITAFAQGRPRVIYKLRDWVFSRQRYWGEPIPIVHCKTDGAVPVPENDLPVLLPNVQSYAPTGTGESPLANIPEWVNTTCPKCGGPAKRETNTMPQWAGSSWYYLRFMDPKNRDAMLGKDKEKYWAPVDVYVGGAEHVTRHLIYARFWHKFLFDVGVVSTVEPFTRRRGVGLVLGESGVKMSKRLGNVINPDDIIEKFGADSLRVYEMFMGPFEATITWSTDNLIGARRFIERVWRLAEKTDKKLSTETETELLVNQTIKKVGEDIEQFAFNTAISQLMIFSNHLEKLEHIPFVIFRKFVCLLAPFVPHVADELLAKLSEEKSSDAPSSGAFREELGHETSLSRETWPTYDPQKILAECVTLAIQVNGKLRDTFSVARETGEEEIKKTALIRPAIGKWLLGKTPSKIIYVPGKIVNIVVR